MADTLNGTINGTVNSRVNNTVNGRNMQEEEMEQPIKSAPATRQDEAREATADTVRMDRRRFLLMAGTLSASAALAACAPRHVGEPTPNWRAATPEVALPSPQPSQPADSTPVPSAGLDAFLAFSALVTGVNTPLDPQVGQVYYEALQANPELEMPIDDLLAQAGYAGDTAPESLESLESEGLFEDEAADAVTQRIINYWYSGVYDTADGERAVATFVDALAWKGLAVTKPLTVCTFPGAWARPPANAPQSLSAPAYLDALAG